MKAFIAIISIVIFAAFTTPDPVQNDLKSLEWIIGTWKILNDDDSQVSYEQWTKVSDKEFVGKGYMVAGKDTTIIEKLRLVHRDDEIIYIADVSQNAAPVEFKLAKHDAASVQFENRDHDYPQWIRYVSIHDKMMHTAIGKFGDDERTIHFFLEKM